MKALATIISLISLYVGYWITKSIYFSFLEGGSTVGDIVKAEWIIAGVVCGIICLTNYLIFDTSTGLLGIVLVVLVAIALSIPYSLGFVLLFNVVMIGCILCSIWKK
jgi:hypothetical protein